ncbi:MAG: ATP-dependent DNA helicase, partial [Alphaproteobacteria bacterium]|nr:ATP-dependent DNA helicase [Alphaproteobacteria bacterium]
MALEPIPARDWRRLPALVPAPGGAVVCDGDGACARVAMDAARRLFRSGDVLIAHAAFVSGRLKTPPAAALYDVLELFAFVRPGAPCIPSALGLARAMGQRIPQTTEENAAALREAAVALIDLLHHAPEEARVHMRMLAGTMGRAGWKWAAPILDVLGESQEKQTPIAGMETWRGLPQWEDSAAPDKPGSLPVSPDDARARLHALVHRMGEMRPEQAEYSDAAAFAFSARDAAGAPKVALVEAGTGVGKTLGYLAPASLWAEKNGPGLWIST